LRKIYLIASVAVIMFFAFEFTKGTTAGEFWAVLGVSLKRHPLGLRLAHGAVEMRRQLLVHAA